MALTFDVGILQLAAIKHMHQSHMEQMCTVMNRLLTRCGDENKLDKEAELLWQLKKKEKKFLFPAAAVSMSYFLSGILSNMLYS